MAPPNCSNCGCKTQIENNKENIITLFQRTDGMKNWVIAGMATVILQCLGVITVLIFAWTKLKGL